MYPPNPKLVLAALLGACVFACNPPSETDATVQNPVEVRNWILVAGIRRAPPEGEPTADATRKRFAKPSLATLGLAQYWIKLASM